MPSAPELGDVPAKVRIAKVLHKVYAKQFGATYGNIGVAAEVSVYLKGKQYSCKQECAAALVLIVCKDFINIHSAVVCNHYLLEESPQHLTASVNSLFIVECTRLLHLRKQVCGPLNWAGHKLRKETHVSKERYRITAYIKFATVDVNAVAQRLKCVETYANWQDYLQGGGMKPNSA